MNTWPYEKNKNVYKELSSADFLVLFNIVLMIIHNTINTASMSKAGKISPWIRIRWMFWEYIKNTGNKAIKIGCRIMIFLEFSSNFI